MSLLLIITPYNKIVTVIFETLFQYDIILVNLMYLNVYTLLGFALIGDQRLLEDNVN